LLHQLPKRRGRRAHRSAKPGGPDDRGSTAVTGVDWVLDIRLRTQSRTVANHSGAHYSRIQFGIRRRQLESTVWALHEPVSQLRLAAPELQYRSLYRRYLRERRERPAAPPFWFGLQLASPPDNDRLARGRVLGTRGKREVACSDRGS